MAPGEGLLSEGIGSFERKGDWLGGISILMEMRKERVSERQSPNVGREKNKETGTAFYLSPKLDRYL